MEHVLQGVHALLACLADRKAYDFRGLCKMVSCAKTTYTSYDVSTQEGASWVWQ